MSKTTSTEGPGQLNRRRLLAMSGVGVAAIAASTMSSSRADALTPAVNGLFDVKAYGATGNGTTDDTAAIKSAVVDAVAAGGGVVYLPSGVYKVSSQIAVTTLGITFLGDGQSASVVSVASTFASGDVFYFDGSAAADPHGLGLPVSQGGGVRGLSIVSSPARTAGAAIHFYNAHNVTAEDVDLSGQYVGIQVDGNQSVQFINRGYYTNTANGGTGIWVNGTTNDTYISGIVMDNDPAKTSNIAAAGLRITATGAVWADNCDFIHAQNNLLIDTPAGSVITWCFFANCAFDTAYSRSMLILPASGASVRGLSFVNCWSSSAQAYDGCYIGGPVDGVEFIGHRFFNNKGNGLYVVGPATNIHVDSCVASGNLAGYGFIFGGSATNFTVRNSRSGPYGGLPSQVYGVGVQAGCNNYMVVGNELSGNTSGPLQDLGGTNKVIANNLS